jgi:hypothetical protein
MMKDNSTQKIATKVFTVVEANAMLPLIRSIVNDIHSAFRSVTGRRSDLHRLLRKGSRTTGPLYDDEVEESRADLQQEYERIWKFREELESLGVLLRQPEEGMIEFPAVVLGEESFLSWQLGEVEVRYYRSAESPRATRLPLPSLEKAQ